jgi:hypothetical protein
MIVNDENTPKTYVTLTDAKTKKSRGFTIVGVRAGEAEKFIKSAVAEAERDEPDDRRPDASAA